jgi:hypothetical protein
MTADERAQAIRLIIASTDPLATPEMRRAGRALVAVMTFSLALLIGGIGGMVLASHLHRAAAAEQTRLMAERVTQPAEPRIARPFTE